MQTTYTDEQCFKNYLQTILNERKNTSKLDEKFMKNNDENSSLVCNLYDKEKYVAHTRPLKQTLYHKLILKKVHGVIKCN